MARDIGISRNQQVFAVIESVSGTLEYPGVTDFIRPAGLALINQVPEFSNSEELRNTLDILDQFQNVNPPGEWSCPMLIRPNATLGGKPQGDPFFQSLQGSVNAATSASLNGGISISAATLSIDGISGGEFPTRGVVTIGTESIYYGDSNISASSGTLTSLSRGFNSTSATLHADNADVALASRYYKQAIESPSFSLWVKTDHFLQGLSGASVNNAVLGVNNEGAVMVNFSGQGMRMVFAGEDAVQAGAATSATLITVEDASRYSAQAKIYNRTKNDDNGAAGYTITRVDTANNQIAISGITETWDQNDVIEGWLPDGTLIGTPIESRHTGVQIDGVAGKFRSNDFTFSVPKLYLIDEVGTTEPEEFVEDQREITSELNIYFRKQDAKYFTLGFLGNESSIGLTFGQSGHRQMDVYMPRAKIKTPEISGDGPTLALSMGLTALGTSGEDSVEICFN